MTMTAWNQRERTGLTLIEVIAGLTLTMVLVSSGALAASRHGWQLRQAQARIEACHSLDQLLLDWTTGPADWPQESSGSVPNRPDWSWSITRGTGIAPIELEADVVRVTIWEQRLGRSAQPLAFVELWRARSR